MVAVRHAMQSVSSGRMSPHEQGEKKEKEKTQQNINSFVYTMPLLSGISLALKQKNSCEGGNSAG